MADRPRALVTGASAGIGTVFARALAARGHDLLLAARDEVRLGQLAADLRAQHGVEAEVVPCDLATEQGISMLVDRIRALPQLDVLVNNAGFGTMGTLAETDPAGQEAMLRLHVMAPARCTQAALPGMLARQGGSVINVSSVASFIYSPSNVNYCATKAYLRVFSEGVASEVSGRGVYVQALCPGFFRSEFHQRMGSETGGIPRWMWLTAEAVVDASLAAMDARGPVVVVPGLQYRLLVAALSVMPRSWFRPLQRVHSDRARR